MRLDASEKWLITCIDTKCYKSGNRKVCKIYLVSLDLNEVVHCIFAGIHGRMCNLKSICIFKNSETIIYNKSNSSKTYE